MPLGERPTYSGARQVRRRTQRLPRRHAWITGPDGAGPHPGLVLHWERRGSGSDSWWAFCVWLVVEEGVTVQQWLPARLVQPA